MLMVLHVVLVNVQRAVVHSQQAEEMIVRLGDGLPRPMFVDVAGHEVFEEPAEALAPIVDQFAITLNLVLLKQPARDDELLDLVGPFAYD
ncbi:MAG: hypothetical protein CFH02_01270, partial [Alphaproteobacteria bacterium MarineAlpha3_Bin1]